MRPVPLAALLVLVGAAVARAGDPPDPRAGVLRAHALLAEMAAAHGDERGAVHAYDAALAAFPKQDIVEPEKFSRFQHLANERAMRTWDLEGFGAALTWAMDLLAVDRRFRTFHAAPWIQRATGEEAKTMDAALQEALRRRRSRFPDLADEIGWK